MPFLGEGRQWFPRREKRQKATPSPLVYRWQDCLGHLSRAARSLGVNPTTVSRRIQALEERVGVRLFERLSSGWATTRSRDSISLRLASVITVATCRIRSPL